MLAQCGALEAFGRIELTGGRKVSVILGNQRRRSLPRMREKGE